LLTAVTESGITTVNKLMQPEKVFEPTDVTELGITNDDNIVQPEKA